MMVDSGPKSILVTGATGLVGSAVVKAVRAAGFDGEVRAATRRPEGGKRGVPERSVPTPFDFDDLPSVRAAVAGVDALFLVTGYSVAMLTQSKRVVDEAKEAGVRRIVHLGALASENEQLAPLIWHQYVERYIEALGFDYAHLRPNFFMETILNGIRRAKGRLFHFFGDARISFVSVDDIAAVAAASLLAPDPDARKVYPLAGDPRTLKEIAAIIARAWGVEIPCIASSNQDLLPILQKTGMEPCYAAGLADHMAAVAAGTWPAADRTFATVQQVLGRPSRRWVDVAADASSTARS